MKLKQLGFMILYVELPKSQEKYFGKQSGFFGILLIWIFVLVLIFGGFFYTKIYYPAFFDQYLGFLNLSAGKAFLKTFIHQESIPATFEGRINFTISEDFKPNFDGPHLFLTVKTLARYPCSGYSINHSLNLINSQMFLALGDIKKQEGLCNPFSDSASFKEQLDLNEGSYTIEIQTKHAADKYILMVTNQSVTIENDPFSSPAISIPEISEFKRPPANLIEARCFSINSKQEDSTKAFCKNFFEEFRTIAQSYLAPLPGIISKNQFYLYSGSNQTLETLAQKYHSLDQNYYIYVSTKEGKAFICSLKSCQTAQASFPNLQIEY